jgi:hypothetical protein
VLLHLPLDLVTGHKIFWPGGPLLGLHLYRRPVLDFAVEVPILVAGWWLLRRAGHGPRWATATAMIVALVLGQGMFDLMERGLKPSSCHWTVPAAP